MNFAIWVRLIRLTILKINLLKIDAWYFSKHTGLENFKGNSDIFVVYKITCIGKCHDIHTKKWIYEQREICTISSAFVV